MSNGPWALNEATRPYGFRVTIERRFGGSVEKHTFPSKTSARACAMKAAAYKQGFQRLVEARPLTREEWQREFGEAKS